MRRVGQEGEVILINYLMGWKGYALAAVVAIVIGAVGAWKLQELRKEAGIAKYEAVASQAKADLESLRADASAILAKKEREAREKERRNVELTAANQVQYEQEKADREKTHQADLAAVRSGALKLRDKYAKQNSSCGIRLSGTEIGPSVPGPDEGGGAELSREATEFLLGEADRADQLAARFNKCVRQLKIDRMPI